MTSQARLKILLSTSTIHFLFLYQKVFLDPKLLWIQKGLLLCSQVQFFLSPSLSFYEPSLNSQDFIIHCHGSNYESVWYNCKWIQNIPSDHFQVWHHPWIRTSRITWMDIRQAAFSTLNFSFPSYFLSRPNDNSTFFSFKCWQIHHILKQSPTYKESIKHESNNYPNNQ